MRAPANFDVFRLRLCAIVVVFLASVPVGYAQRFQLGLTPPNQSELTSPHVDLAAGATSARLAQAQALIADKNWDEGIDAFRGLAASGTDHVVAIDDHRYVNLRDYCNLQIAKLPADGLAAYRRRVDPMAEQMYRVGVATRDERKLDRVVEESFCSRWGDDALLALGELALERGDYDAARRAWEQISPLLRSPDGQSLWIALRDIDLAANWPESERRWQSRSQPADWLAYPDTNLELADVRARLVLASVRAGQLERAQLEFQFFRRLHPDAVGRFGGQQGPFVSALERLLSSAREWPPQPSDANWPTFAGSPSRSPNVVTKEANLVPAWSEPIAIAPENVPRANSSMGDVRLFRGGIVNDRVSADARSTDVLLSCFPVVAGDFVIFADATSIRAAELATGRAAIARDGVLDRTKKTDDEKSEVLPFASGGAVAYGAPRYSLTVAGDIVYGRVGPVATSRLAAARTSGDRLIGFDLRREGLLTFTARPENASWSFDGVPVSNGRHLFVAVRHGDVTPHAYVTCFDAATGSQLWRTSIGSADTPAAGLGDEITHNLLTLVEDRVYFNTNLGLVAALDSRTGEICWLRRYDRLLEKRFTPGGTGSLQCDRDPTPALYHEGLVIVAPSDSPMVFALDADTGKLIWESDQMADGFHLLGVSGGTLVVGGNRLRAVDVRSGQVRWVWPESEHGGIRGMGRGVVAGDEIFWPTRREIYAMSAATGVRTRSPISLERLGAGGANLAAAHGWLIAAGPEKLLAFGPNSAAPVSPAERQAQLSNND